jgi:ATPase family associated with various cellular activities (AAA)
MTAAIPLEADVAEAFAILAEASALAALSGIAADGVAGAGVFAPVAGWLDTTPMAPLARVRDGFRLQDSEVALMILLFAAQRSEMVARAVAGLGRSGDDQPSATIPVWLARRAIQGLGTVELASQSALRRFHLVEAPDGAGVSGNLSLPQAVAERLCGQVPRDPDLSGWVTALAATGTTGAEAGSLAAALRTGFAARGPGGLPPLVAAPDLRPAEIARAMSDLGLAPFLAEVGDLPSDPATRDRLAAIWSREAALDSAALIIDANQAAGPGALAAFADRVVGQVVVCGTRMPVALARGVFLLRSPGDAPARAKARWLAELGPDRAARVGAGLTRIVQQFRLEPEGIAAAVADARPAIDTSTTPGSAEAALWHAAARAVPPAEVPGVSVIEPGYGWSDLILPPQTEAALRRIEAHVRHAGRVFDDWGFAARVGGAGTWRGRGVAVLFAGPSGTGKTMAAEVLASALDLRIMVLDLSQIISKYIGETAKNIAAAFAQAERLGAVMVWNEGDAIWGARGGVGNATDRHVNAEVGDLLQRIESFAGFTVVTTNLRHAIDPAFLRRFRFVVDVPLPAAEERLRLWAHAFPKATPVEPMDWRALMSLPLSGGVIRNVALGAAFRAAAEGRPVSREMVTAELAEELRKQNLPVPHINWEFA